MSGMIWGIACLLISICLLLNKDKQNKIFTRVFGILYLIIGIPLFLYCLDNWLSPLHGNRYTLPHLSTKDVSVTYSIKEYSIDR